MAELKIVKCNCGRKPIVARNMDYFRVVCRRKLHGQSAWAYSCWIGPIRKTRRGAIDAWNRVMGAAGNGRR